MPALWFPPGPPSSNDTVLVAGTPNATLDINASTIVDVLSLASPQLAIARGATLLVKSRFDFRGGTLSGAGALALARGATGLVPNDDDDNNNNNNNVSAERRIVGIELRVEHGADLVFEGPLYLGRGANLSVAGSLIVLTSALLLPSVADLGFDATENAVLNDRLEPKWSLPALGAVDDVVATDSVHPFLRDSMYDLDPENAVAARDVYVRAGWPLEEDIDDDEGHVSSRYDLERRGLDLEACAELCEAREWCASFDHRAAQRWCALSRLDARAAGGLSDNAYAAEPATHYEKRATTAVRWTMTTASRPLRPLLAVLPGGVVDVRGSLNASVFVQLRSSGRFEVASTADFVSLAGGLTAAAAANVTSPFLLLFFSGRSGASFDFDDDAILDVPGGLGLEDGAVAKLPARVSSPDATFSLQGASRIRAVDAVLDVDIRRLDLGGASSIDVANLTIRATTTMTVCSDCTITGDNIHVDIGGNFSLYGSMSVDGGGSRIPNFGDASGAGQSGGSGGGHGGAGGGGLGAGGAASAGVAGHGCLWWPRTPGGAGGRMSSRETSGGAGGGVVAVHVRDRFVLDGTLSANGLDGTEATGGGAGGSVIVNASTLVGDGRATANGGAGGYPGGWLAGGGGGGGRVLVIAHSPNSSIEFYGSLAADAGAQETFSTGASTRGGGLSGPGTVLVFYANTGVLFLSLVSGRKTMTLAHAPAPLNSCGASHIPDATLAAAANAGVVDAIWLAGGARASVVDGQSLHVRGYDCESLSKQRLLWSGWSSTCNRINNSGDIAGDGTARLEVISGNLSLPENATITRAKILFDVSNTRLQRGASTLTVSGSGGAIQLAGSGSFSHSSNSASWSFRNGSSLEQIDPDSDAELELASLEVVMASSVAVAKNLTLNTTRLTVSDKSTLAAYAAAASRHSPRLAFRRGFSTINSSAVSRLVLVVEPRANLTVAGSELELSLGAVVHNIGNIEIVGVPRIAADVRGINATRAAPRLVNAENATLVCSGGRETTIILEARLDNYGRFAAVGNIHLVLSGGGVQFDTGTTIVKPLATVSIGGGDLDTTPRACESAADCEFRFSAASHLRGGGSLVSRGRAVATLPSLVEPKPQDGVALSVFEGGEMKTTPGSAIGDIAVSGGDLTAYGAVMLEKLTIAGGTMRVRDSVTIMSLNFTGGEIRIDGEMTARVAAWSVGDVYGPGAMRVSRRLNLYGGVDPGQSVDDLSSCPRLLEGATATVLGVVAWTNGGNVVISQASKLILDDGAVMNISGDARLITGGVLYNFTRTRATHSSFDTWPPALELTNVTRSACAAACVDGSGDIALAMGHRVAARLVVAMGSLGCRGFDYERYEARCVLHVQHGDLLEETLRWDHYRLRWWQGPPKLIISSNATLTMRGTVTLDTRLESSSNSSVVRVGSDSRLRLRGGGCGNGTFDIGTSAVLEVALPEGGVREGSAFDALTSVFRGARDSRLAFSGGGPHTLAKALRAENLCVTVDGGALVELPPTNAKVILRSLNVSNSSVLTVVAATRLVVVRSVDVTTNAEFKFSVGGAIAAQSVLVRLGGTLSSSSTGTLLLMGSVTVIDDGRLAASDTINVSLCDSLRVGSGEVSAARVFLECANATIASGGTVHADGLGSREHGTAPEPRTPGTAHGGGGGGGGHGGTGGPGASGSSGGSAFGRADGPKLNDGGGAGAPVGTGGRGGGVVSLVTTTGTLTIDGMVSARGASGIHGGGGGAGGSVVLRALNGDWTGRGRVSVDGGNGDRAARNWIAGGGGGGGRIFGFVAGVILFKGSISSVGGDGFDQASGWGWFDGELPCALESCNGSTSDLRVRAASGTLYVSLANATRAAAAIDDRSDALALAVVAAAQTSSSTAILVDNGGVLPRNGLQTSVGAVPSVGALSVTGAAAVTLDRGMPFALGRLLGTGSVHVGNGTVLDNLTSSELFVVSNVTVEVARHAAIGRSNHSRLRIGANGTVSLGPGSTCGGGKIGWCVLEALEVESGGTLQLLRGLENDTLAEAWAKLSPALSLNNLTISNGGLIAADGIGHPGGKNTNIAPAWFAGRYGPSGGGGGAHAGGGGNGLGGNGGVPRESLIEAPEALGGGGGAAHEGFGGAGGGRVRIDVSGDARLDGWVTSRGADATGSGGGGGAGGSIWVSVNGTCRGTGALLASGGRGSRSTVTQGGGGGGGRVALSCRHVAPDNFRTHFRMVAFGGRSFGIGATEGERGAFPSSSGALADDVRDMSAGSGGTLMFTLLANASRPALHYLGIDGTENAEEWNQSTATTLIQSNVSYDLAELALTSPTNVRLVGTAIKVRSWELGRGGSKQISLDDGASIDVENIPSALELVVGDARLLATDLVVRQNATLALTSSGRTRGAPQGNYSFETLRIEGQVRINGNASIDATSLIIDAGAHIHADGEGGRGARDAASSGGGLEPGASLVSFARVRSGTPRGAGGAHAGAGGGIEIGRRGYGSALFPVAAGSGGGASDRGGGGSGGGVLAIRVFDDCHLLGLLSSKGQDGRNGGGGGAGGSVWLDVFGALRGNGTIDVSGGDALGEYGGAGAGGRAAVYTKSSRTWNGRVIAAPGSQTDRELDSPAGGTILLASGDNMTLIADGGGADIVVIDDATLTSVYVDDGARLAFLRTVVNVTGGVSGNGIVRVTDAASLILTIEPQLVISRGLRIEASEGGRIVAANAKNVSVDGVLSLLDGGLFSETSTMVVNGVLELSAGGAAGSTPKTGRYTFGTLNVTTGGVVRVLSRNISSTSGIHDDNALNDDDDTHVRYDDDYAASFSRFPLESVNIDVRTRLVVLGSINGNSGGPRGGRGTLAAAEGGKAGGVALGGGGGGHGGKGGFSVRGASGGTARGAAFAPLGGGGGGASGLRGNKGGEGGAGLRIIVHGDALVDGNVSANGADVVGDSGGGAGGSVWFTATTLSGAGRFSADGGSASYSIFLEGGGAGSGGRIAVECSGAYSFHGIYSAVGGAQHAVTPRFALAQTLARTGGTKQKRALNDDDRQEGIFAPASIAHRKARAESELGKVAEAAPGTIALRTLSPTAWDWLRVQGRDNNSVVSTATTLCGSENVSVAFRTVELSSGAALYVPSYTVLTVDNVTGRGTMVLDTNAVVQQSDALEISRNATMQLRDGAQFRGMPALVVAPGATVDVASKHHLSRLIVHGTVQGSLVHLNVSGNIVITGQVIADGFGDVGADAGHDNAQGVGNGGSSALGGSGGGHGGAGVAGLGALYAEALADTALNDVNISADMLSTAAAQFLVAGFPSGTPNTTRATDELLANAKWRALQDFAAAVASGDDGVASGDAIYAEVLRGGSVLQQYLVNSRVFASSGGRSHGNAYRPTTRGSGGGARHAVTGHGGRGGGVVRLQARDIIVTGVVSADGEAGGAGGGGGGAGGSVWLEACERLLGGGIVSADGGSGGGNAFDRDTDHWQAQFGWVSRADRGGGGGGGGGRIAVSANCSTGLWHGVVRARPGAPAWNSSLALEPLYLGTIAWLNQSLVRNATIHTAAQDGTLRPGDYADIDVLIPRRAPVQVLRAVGFGNGSVDAADEHAAIIRGSWRLRYRSSAWSPTLTTQATAGEVHAALTSLDTLSMSSLSVDRNLNDNATGWVWSVTFHETPIASDTPRTPPLIVLDTRLVYSTEGNATIEVERDVDQGNSHVSSPLAYANAREVGNVVRGASNLGISNSARWISPSTLRVTIHNASGAALAAEVAAAALEFSINASISNASGIWVPGGPSVYAQWTSLKG